MPKKYIQLLLSINFCLTAVTAIANSDAKPNTSSMLPTDISTNDIKNDFDQIWECLDEIEIIYESKSLEEFIEEHKNRETPYDEKSAEISSKILSEDYHEFRESLLYFLDLPDQDLDQFSKNKLASQKEKFLSHLEKIDEFYFLINQHNLKKEKLFFANQCRKFQNISFNEILENSMMEEEDFAFQNTAPDDNEENGTTSNKSFIRKQFNGQFKRIWRGLERIHKNYPSSEALQASILEHKQLKNPTGSNEEDLVKDLDENFSFLRKKMPLLPECQLVEESLSKGKKHLIKKYFNKIIDRMQIIESLYAENKTTLSKNTQVSLRDRLAELVSFSENFLKEDLERSLKSHNISIDELTNKDSLHPEPSSMQILDNQLHQIWVCLENINTIHGSELLQELISHYKNVKIPYNERSEKTSKKTLENLFTQLHKDLKVCSQYQAEEELGNLNIQFNQIKSRLNFIHEIYNSKKESLSKKEKAFLSDQLIGVQKFFSTFITENSLQEESTTSDELSSLKKVQRSLDSCQEEDSSIYLQFEYIINSQEADISDLLTSSQAENNIMNHFLYFNEAEGLIEIQHEELKDEMLRDEGSLASYTDGIVEVQHEMLGDEEYSEPYTHKPYMKPYTTIWKIRPADVKTLKSWNWQEHDGMLIGKTGFLLKYTLLGETLEYTLTHIHNNESIRANFVCKSSNENTYTILSIDYFENIVVLKNGPCLFAAEGDLKQWHAGDTVILQTDGAVTDTNNTHKLFNKTRSYDKVWVLLKKKF